MPSYEYRDGELTEIPDIVVAKSGDLWDDVSRTLVVSQGVTVTAHGRLTGTVVVSEGATLHALNDVLGTVTVAPNGTVNFHRAANGTIDIKQGAVATLAATATALGTMTIDGTLINRGTRGTNVRGTGVVQDQEGASVRHPDEMLGDGTVIYRD